MNKATHANMMRLEDTIKELRNNAAEQKKQMSKNKQNEKVSVSECISSYLVTVERSVGENRRINASQLVFALSERERSDAEWKTERTICEAAGRPTPSDRLLYKAP